MSTPATVALAVGLVSVGWFAGLVGQSIRIWLRMRRMERPDPALVRRFRREEAGQ